MPTTVPVIFTFAGKLSFTAKANVNLRRGDNNLPVKSKNGSGARENSNEMRAYFICFKPANSRLQTTAHSDTTPSCHKSEKGTIPTYWGNMFLRELLNEKNPKKSCLISWSGISVDAYSSPCNSEHKLILYNFPI